MAILVKDDVRKQKILESRESEEPTRTPASDILMTPERRSASAETPTKVRKRISSSEKGSWTAEQQQASERMLAIFIGGSNLPVSAVEDPNMEKYVKTLNPQVLA